LQKVVQYLLYNKSVPEIGGSFEEILS